MIPIALSFLAGVVIATLALSIVHATYAANKAEQYLRELDELTTQHKVALWKTYQEGREHERHLHRQIGEMLPAIEASAVGKN